MQIYQALGNAFISLHFSNHNILTITWEVITKGIFHPFSFFLNFFKILNLGFLKIFIGV